MNHTCNHTLCAIAQHIDIISMTKASEFSILHTVFEQEIQIIYTFVFIFINIL